jgi:hypothetical protein
VDVDHLHARELLDDGARCEVRGPAPSSCS